jgi:YVTN family beta-propeller protein
MGAVPDAVKRLVDHFDQNRKVFLSGDYKEEQLRAEFQDRPVTGGRMRLTFLAACLVLLAVTLASGLEPEWTILLPDSLSGLPGPQCAAYNPMTDKVYVGGSGNCVLVIDCATNKKVARIATRSGVTAMFVSPVSGRLYCAGDVITVIDCVGDTVVRTLPVSQWAFCYNSRSQELYAYSRRSIIVVNTRTDSIVDTLNVGAFVLCYNPHDDKVYCRTGNGVRILSGRDGAFIADVPLENGAWENLGDHEFNVGVERGSLLCYNPASNKVYCANYGSKTVTVIDGSTNAIVATVVAGPGLVGICCNPSNNKVYLANGAYPQSWPFHEIGDSTVSVVDGATDKVIATVATHGRPMVLSYDSASGEVLAACRVATTPAESSSRVPAAGRGERKPTVDIIDGRSNRLTASATMRHEIVAFCFDSRRRSAYCLDPDRDQPDVVVLAIASGEVMAKLPTARHPGVLCHNSRDNKLYCSIRRDGELVVLDGATNRILTRVKNGREPWRLCYNSKEDKVYCDGEYDTRVLVLDGKTDSVKSNLMIGSPVWYDSLNNWVYSFKQPWATGRVAVTDGTTDSIIAEVPFHDPWSFCGNPKADKVYCHSDQTGELAIIDGPTHALVKTMQIGTGPIVLCCNYKDNKVYCAAKKMMVIDGTTNAVDTSYFMPADAMGYNARNNKLYVGGRLGLSVIDAATNRVIANFKEHEDIRLIYHNSRDNCVYCVNWSQVTVIDGATNKVLRTYAVPSSWHALACNTEQNRIYVANQDGYSISVIRGGGP